MNLSTVLYGIRTFMLLIKSSNLNRLLESEKNIQRKDFENIKKLFTEKFKNASRESEAEYMLPAWQDKTISLKRDFLPYPPFYFLRNPIVLKTMFVAAGGKWLKEQLVFLESKLTETRLKELLKEDLVGGPLLLNSKYLTSHNTIHHLYHLERFVRETGYKFFNGQIVVEWGGGYGNLAKVICRYNAKIRLTYIIVDSSLFSCIQWLYLSTVLGQDGVRLISNKKDKIKPGMINIIPLGFLKYFKIRADLFISTWALSESNQYSQNLVYKADWFGAQGILVGYQRSSNSFPHADQVATILKKKGAKIEEIQFLYNNYYAFLYTSLSKITSVR